MPERGDSVKIYCILDYIDTESFNMNGKKPAAEFTAKDSYGVPYSGYFTIPLEKPVKVGFKFAIVVEYDSAVVPVEYPKREYSSQASANAGESFVFGESGGRLTDVSASNQNICVKAVTMSAANEDERDSPGVTPSVSQRPDANKYSALIIFNPHADLTRSMVVEVVPYGGQSQSKRIA